MPRTFRLRRWWWWSAEERQRFKRRLLRASPYILILVLPGSFVLLPLYALWRERRRRKNHPALLQLPDKSRR